jgi:hypothetical protein
MWCSEGDGIWIALGGSCCCVVGCEIVVPALKILAKQALAAFILKYQVDSI